MTAKTEKDQRGRGPGRPFAPGTSGNPRGRPSGSRHKTTLAMEALLDGEAEKLTRKAIELALAGDMVALRLCLDRTIPPPKGSPRSVRTACGREHRRRGQGLCCSARGRCLG